MNQNSIRCTNPNFQPNLFVRLPGIEIDPRVKYIESVCQVLIESRFGPGCVKPVVINFGDRPELEPVPLLGRANFITSAILVYSALKISLGRKGYQLVEAAYQRAKQMGIVDAAPNAHNSTAALTPNQGRGSP